MKKDSNTIFMAVVVGLLVVVFFAIIFGAKYVYVDWYPTMEYNGFVFKQKNNFWHTEWQRGKQLYGVALRFNPVEVEGVPVSGVLNASFNKRPVLYITYDPLSESSDFKYLALAASELTLNLAGPLGKNVVAACTRNDSSCSGRPIVTCDTVDKNVIFLQADGESRIVLNNTCMTLFGEAFDVIKSVDKTLYVWMNIMEKPESAVEMS